MGKNIENKRRVSPEEAVFAIPAGNAVIRQQAKAIHEKFINTGKVIDRATILKLFSKEKNHLTPDQIQSLGDATNSYIDLIESLEVTSENIEAVLNLINQHIGKK